MCHRSVAAPGGPTRGGGGGGGEPALSPILCCPQLEILKTLGSRALHFHTALGPNVTQPSVATGHRKGKAACLMHTEAFLIQKGLDLNLEIGP